MFAADIVALLQPSGAGDLLLLGAIGLPEELAGRPISGLEDGYAAVAINDRGPVLVESALGDPKIDSQFAELGSRRRPGCRSWAARRCWGAGPGPCQPVPFTRSDAEC